MSWKLKRERERDGEKGWEREEGRRGEEKGGRGKRVRQREKEKKDGQRTCIKRD